MSFLAWERHNNVAGLKQPVNEIPNLSNGNTDIPLTHKYITTQFLGLVQAHQ
jgi:hypothetical protein